MIDFLNNGGSLYFESVNIGLDYENTTFFDYLGINFTSDGGDDEIHTLKGEIPNNDGLLKYNYLGGHSPHYGCDILSGNGAIKLFSSEEGSGRMFVNETNDYKVISSSGVIAAYADGDTLNLKPYLLSEFTNYFLNYNTVTSLQENISRIVSGNLYPNPFSSDITIEFDIDYADQIFVGIYNINGQLIKELVNNELLPGSYKYNWDATNKNGVHMKNGFYFCKISNGIQTVTEKLILLQ